MAAASSAQVVQGYSRKQSKPEGVRQSSSSTMASAVVPVPGPSEMACDLRVEREDKAYPPQVAFGHNVLL